MQQLWLSGVALRRLEAPDLGQAADCNMLSLLSGRQLIVAAPLLRCTLHSYIYSYF